MMLDSVLLEILRNKVTSVTEEMGITLQRTGRTLYVKETADFGTALADLNGKFFAWPLDIGVSGFVDLDCGPTISAVGELSAGDVIITNHPYASGGLCTHTPDLNLVRPYFYEDRIVSYGWTFVHSADVGGKVPSSVSPTNSEAYQEGLLIPPMKIVRKGNFNKDLITLFRHNVRTPDLNIGDIKAMLAALDVGQTRITEIIEQYGLDVFLAAQEALINYAAAKARTAFRQIPDGAYEFWDYLDDDAFTQIPVRVRLRMEVNDGLIHLDYTGSDPQTMGPFNVVTMGRSHPWVTLRLLSYVISKDPTCPVNSGVFRNVTVDLPHGSVLNPEFPAASGIRMAAGVRSYDAVNGALSKALPDFMPAASGGNSIPVVLVEPLNGGQQSVTVVQFLVGGLGARKGHDGVDGRDPSFSNMANNPIETIEAEASVLVLDYGVRADSGGPGEWRGGAGQKIKFKVLLDGCQLLARGLERLRFPPWGAAGGRSSTVTRFILNEGLAGERDLGKIDMVSLNAGDTVTAYLSGAGGYGDPFSRDPESVRKDVTLGFVTDSGAQIDYGVVIKAGEVDECATETLRAGRTSPRPVDFDYGEEREAWESVFDDERMVALNRALVGYAPAQRQRIRKTIFGSIDERLLVPATEKRHDFRNLMGDGDGIAVSFDQLLSAIPDAAT
jgi:N-methylhydantoinase B